MMMKLMMMMLMVVMMIMTSLMCVNAKYMYGENYMATPQGYVLSHCHHRVPNGARLTYMNDKSGGIRVTDKHGQFIKILPKCRSSVGAPIFVSKTGEPLKFTHGDRSHHVASESDRHHDDDRNNNNHRDDVASKSTTDNDDGGRTIGTKDYDGWLGFTAYQYSQSFDSYLGDFSVPAKPSEDPEVLYLFTGLQSDDWIPVVDPYPNPISSFDIIQPVLQYPGDYGNYWSVKSWYVTLDVGTVASDEVQASPGDKIFGNMTRTGNQAWFIGSTVMSTQQITSVSVDHPRLSSQPWAFNTLECYGCDGCSTYPKNSPCKFTRLQLISDGKLVSPKWQVNPQPSPNMQCNELPVVVDPATVTIYFDKSSTE